MRVEVNRKSESHWFNGVKSLTVIKKGRLFPHVYVAMKFREGASTGQRERGKDGYVGSRNSRKVNPDETPRMGMDYCEEIRTSEEVNE